MTEATRDAEGDRIGTHWEGCWEDGGRRHYLCAVEEARRQKARADAAEAHVEIVTAELRMTNGYKDRSFVQMGDLAGRLEIERDLLIARLDVAAEQLAAYRKKLHDRSLQVQSWANTQEAMERSGIERIERDGERWRVRATGGREHSSHTLDFAAAVCLVQQKVECGQQPLTQLQVADDHGQQATHCRIEQLSAELAAATARVQELEVQLDAVPVVEIRSVVHWAGGDMPALALRRDISMVSEWLERQEAQP